MEKKSSIFFEEGLKHIKKLKLKLQAMEEASEGVDSIRKEIELQLVGTIMAQVTNFMEELIKMLQHKLESGRDRVLAQNQGQIVKLKASLAKVERDWKIQEHNQDLGVQHLFPLSELAKEVDSAEANSSQSRLVNITINTRNLQRALRDSVRVDLRGIVGAVEEHKVPHYSGDDRQISNRAQIVREREEGEKVDHLMRISRGRSIIHAFNLVTNRYFKVKVKQPIPFKAASAQAGNRIFWSGGLLDKGSVPIDSVRWYDISMPREKTVPSLLSPRFQHCMVASSAYHLYVLGGQTGAEITRKVESYDESTNTWTAFPPLCKARTKFAACILGDAYLYAFCGLLSPPSNRLDLEHDETLESCSVATKKWKLMKIQLNSSLLSSGARIAVTPLSTQSILLYGRKKKRPEQEDELSYIFALDGGSAAHVIQEPQKIVPQCTGYWCPGVLKNGEVWVMSDDNDAPVVYRFGYVTRSWELIQRNEE